VSGLCKCTYRDPFENPYSFMNHFVKLHQFPMLFHQENASKKYQFILIPVVKFTYIFVLQFSSNHSSAKQFGVIYLET